MNSKPTIMLYKYLGLYRILFCSTVRIIKCKLMLSAFKHSLTFIFFSSTKIKSALLTAAQQMIHNIFYIFTSFCEQWLQMNPLTNEFIRNDI